MQAETFDFPDRLFEPVVHQIARPRADRGQVAAAAALLRNAERPLLVAGGGVHYSLAEAELADFAERHGIPVVETVAGKSSLVAGHPSYAGPIGVIGAEGANALAADADVVIAVGTRLGDFATGSWSVFGNPQMRLIGINTARFDAGKGPAPTMTLLQTLVPGSSRQVSDLIAGLRAGGYVEAHRNAQDRRQIRLRPTMPLVTEIARSPMAISAGASSGVSRKRRTSRATASTARSTIGSIATGRNGAPRRARKYSPSLTDHGPVGILTGAVGL